MQGHVEKGVCSTVPAVSYGAPSLEASRQTLKQAILLSW